MTQTALFRTDAGRENSYLYEDQTSKQRAIRKTLRI